MAGSIVQHAYTESDTEAFTIVATISGVTAGNCLVAFFGFSDNASGTVAISSVADAQGSYTIAGAKIFFDDPAYATSAVYLLPNANAGSHTVTVTLGDQREYRRLRVLEISGVATASVLDQAMQGIDDASQFTSGASSATTNANDFVLGFMANWFDAVASSVAAVAPYTFYATDSNYMMAVEYKSVSATGAQSAEFTGTNGQRTLHVVALKESGGGSTNTDYSPSSATLAFSGAAPLINPQYARPSADTATVGNWTKSAGSTYYENLDETTPSDSDYILSGINPSGDEIVLKLATISDPGTDVGFHIQWRAGAVGTTGQVTGTLVYDFTGTPVTIQAFVHSGLPVGSAVEFDDAVSSANIANIADFSKLYFKIKAD